MGLALLPFLRALRFQTWYPVYLGFSRIPRTAEAVQCPMAMSERVGLGGGLIVGPSSASALAMLR